MPPATERVPLPHLAPPPPRPGFPVVATLAPLVLALVLWLVTSSPYTLLFALLGPVVGVATALDARRTARRVRRAELAEAREQLRSLQTQLARRLEERAQELVAAAPRYDAFASGQPDCWRIGTGEVPSGIELAAERPPAELAAEVDALRERVAVLCEIPVTMAAADEVVVTGVEPLVRSFARGLVLQAVARCEPGAARVTVPPDEDWADELPGRVHPGPEWEVRAGGAQVLRIRRSAATPGVPVIRLGEAGEEPRAEVAARSWRPLLLARPEAAHAARALAQAAGDAGWSAGDAISSSVDLGALLEATSTHPPTAAAIGCDAAGPVLVDLESSGPHALVAGTTGSGKSELLVSWVLALAARRPPGELSFLLVDFKGGASFAPLTVLPHVVGVVSDLDAVTAARAVRSLRAELRRREQLLADHGVRDAGGLAPGVLPRLVIVVDEYAALVDADPELQQTFADLASRGRSLGLHLVLGTQRPAGVVRDAVLANVTVRVCLRVLDAADSVATVGVPDAAELPSEPRGRALLRGSDRPGVVQLALSSPGLPGVIAAHWAGHPVPASRPWLDPLPARLSCSELPSAAGPVVGLVDVPESQRRDPLVLDPWAGSVLVLGASGSGRTETLATLAAVSGAREVRWVPDEPAELWQALTIPAGRDRTLVLVDDLDLLLARGDAEQRAELTELIGLTCRETRRTKVALAASARGAGGAMATAAGAFEQRVLLRMPSREEHLLAGGEAAVFRAERRPGSAVWRGHEAQLALAPSRPEPWRAPPPVVELSAGRWALATPDPARWIARLGAAGVGAAPLGPGADAAVLVGDPDSWLAEHHALSIARRDGSLLLHGCSRAELRMLTRTRLPVPPLAGDDEAWRAAAGRVERVAIP
ncbi:MAG: FtsK/SpoIIIE domain-containing protein [Protaetiibacter sp.]